MAKHSLRAADRSFTQSHRARESTKRAALVRRATTVLRALSLVVSLYCASVAAEAPSIAPQVHPELTRAAAQEQSLLDTIHVEPDVHCIEQKRLVAHVRMWLGSVLVPRATKVRVHGGARPAQALVFDVTRAGTTRQRTFDPPPHNCDEAHAVLGLAIALALDEEHTEQLIEHARPAAPLVRRLSIQASAGYEVMPGASFGLQLGTELAASSWFSGRVDLFTQYAWRRVIAGSYGQFDALLAAVSGQACAGGQLDAEARLSLCLGPAVGALHAWGHGYAPNRAATSLWLGMRSGLRVEARLGVRWVLDLEAVFPLYAPSFSSRQASGAELKRNAGAAGILLSVGPAFTF
jgi:hypothetical protein